jgi:DNA excision repair protein ERCC-4
LVSPTEPPDLRALGETSPLPEEYGADYLFPAATGLVAVQRKTFPDLIASLRDGRLAREIPLLRTADHPLLLLEGRPFWTSEGVMVGGNFSRQGWYGVELSTQIVHNIHIVHTDDLADTARWLRYAPSWFAKPEHTGLAQRPKPTDNFGHMTERDFAIHLLQSFPGIGPKVAEAIYRHFGRVPLQLSVSARDLAQVPGVGKVRAETILRCLGAQDEPKQRPRRKRGGTA